MNYTCVELVRSISSELVNIIYNFLLKLLKNLFVTLVWSISLCFSHDTFCIRFIYGVKGLIVVNFVHNLAIQRPSLN